MKTKIELTEEDVKKAVTCYLETQGYVTHKVDIKVGMECRGFASGEHEAAAFQGVTVEVENIDVENNRIISSLGKQMKYIESKRQMDR